MAVCPVSVARVHERSSDSHSGKWVRRCTDFSPALPCPVPLPDSLCVFAWMCGAGELNLHEAMAEMIVFTATRCLHGIETRKQFTEDVAVSHHMYMEV